MVRWQHPATTALLLSVYTPILSAAQTEDCVVQQSRDTEFTGLVQSLNRRTLNLAPAQSRGRAVALHQSATQMLQDGGNQSDAQTFAKNTAEVIGTLVPNLQTEHDKNKDVLVKLWAKFAEIKKKLADEIAYLKTMAMSDTVHSTCRGEQNNHCVTRKTCQKDLKDKEEAVDEQNGLLKLETEKIEKMYCESGEDKVKTQFRIDSVKVFKDYIRIKEAWDGAVKVYDDKLEICKKAEANEKNKRRTCEQEQKKLEKQHCDHGAQVRRVRSSIKIAWDSAVRTYDTAKGTFEKLSADRKKEYVTLKQVECLLNNINKTAGKPCDEADTGATDEKIHTCNNLKTDTTFLDLTFQSPPEEPSLPSLPEEPLVLKDDWTCINKTSEITACLGYTALEAIDPGASSIKPALLRTNCPSPSEAFSICAAWGDPHFSHVFYANKTDDKQKNGVTYATEHEHTRNGIVYEIEKQHFRVGPYELARSKDNSFIAQAFFCWAGSSTTSVCGVALALGKDRITFVRGKQTGPPVLADLSDKNLFDFIKKSEFSAKDSVDIRFNGKLIDWDTFGKGKFGGGTKDNEGGSWAPEGEGGGRMLTDSVWIQQLDPHEDRKDLMMMPTCLGNGNSFTFSFAVPYMKRVYEPLIALYLSDDMKADTGICGSETGGQHPIPWNEVLFTVEERHQLCTVCDMGETRYDNSRGKENEKSVTFEEFKESHPNEPEHDIMAMWNSLTKDNGCAPRVALKDDLEKVPLEERCEDEGVEYAKAETACYSFKSLKHDDKEEWFKACVMEYCASRGDPAAVTLAHIVHNTVSKEKHEVFEGAFGSSGN